MSALITKFICSTLMSIVGLKVVKNMTGVKEKLLSIKAIVLMTFLIIIPAIIYTMDYNYIYSILIYVMTIITYKEILKISVIKSTLACGIMMITLIFVDLIVSSFLALFITVDELRNIWYINLPVNIFCASILIFVFSRRVIVNYISNLISKLEDKKPTKIVFAIIITVTTLCTLSVNIIQ